MPIISNNNFFYDHNNALDKAVPMPQYFENGFERTAYKNKHANKAINMFLDELPKLEDQNFHQILWDGRFEPWHNSHYSMGWLIKMVNQRALSNPTFWTTAKLVNFLDQAIRRRGLYSLDQEIILEAQIPQLIIICINNNIDHFDLLKLLPPKSFYHSFYEANKLAIASFIINIARALDKNGMSIPQYEIGKMKRAKEYLIAYYSTLLSTESKDNFLTEACDQSFSLGKIFAAKRGIRGTLEGALNTLKNLASNGDNIDPPIIETATVLGPLHSNSMFSTTNGYTAVEPNAPLKFKF